MKIHHAFVVQIIAVLFAVSAHGDIVETLLDCDGMDRDAKLLNCRYDREAGVIMLDDTRLYEDDAPATGVPEGYDYRGREWKEELVKGVVIRKLLVIDDPRAIGGCLLFKGIEPKDNAAPLYIAVNGVTVVRPATKIAAPLAKQYTAADWDRWFTVDLPVGALKYGENEILMWTESAEPSWRVLIALEEEFSRGSLTRPHHPNRSMKSTDGGETWRDNRLGATDEVDGEYSVRISLDQHLPDGEYLSPAFDAVEEGCAFKRRVHVESLRYRVDADIPDETSLDCYARFGNSPFSGGGSWTEWVRFDANTDMLVDGGYRYIQWKAMFATQDSLKSPSISGFSLAADYETVSPNGRLGVAVSVEHNGHVARSSRSYGYEDLSHPGLREYREKYRLDEVIEGARTEFEAMMRLLNWAYRIPLTKNQYSWDWNDVPLFAADENGKPKLQAEYDGRRRDAMCLYSNQALVGALLACGYQARHINIHSEGVSGHEVSEVWSNDFNKWIYMDATRDYYYFDPDTGVPLSLLELHDLLKAEIPRVETWRRPFATELVDSIGPRIRVGMREGDNVVSIVPHGTHLLEIMGHFRIIPRNNFLSYPRPVPVHTGATMWGWDGFLNWYDDVFPKRREYQLQTNRPLDFYEPLNQAEVFLSETDEPGVLRVETDTFTPGGFDCFLVRIDDGAWEEVREAAWDWPLAGGIHMLEIRTRNMRGVRGPVSRLTVTSNP